MATRFGGASPTHAYSIRMRYIVGCLLLVIIVLLATLLYFVQRKPTETVAATTDTFAAPISPSTNVDVVVARQRIEHSTPLDKSMFAPMQWAPEQLPEGVIMWRDVDAFIPNRFAAQMLLANMPVTKEAITDVKPISQLNIPPGFRAVTITVDTRTGVEGWAKPNTRVDVRLTVTDKKTRQKKIVDVARFVKILSVSGQTGTGGEARATVQGITTVTLLVEEQVSKKIELARTMGELSLALVGDVEPTAAPDSNVVVTERDLFMDSDVEVINDEPVQGVITTTDPRTGRPQRMVLKNGRWVRDQEPAQ